MAFINCLFLVCIMCTRVQSVAMKCGISTGDQGTKVCPSTLYPDPLLLLSRLLQQT